MQIPYKFAILIFDVGDDSSTSVDFSTAESLQRIDEKAFIQCKELKSVDIPSSVKVIALNAFSQTGLTSVKFLGKTQPNYCSISAFSSTSLEKANVPSNYEDLRFCGLNIEKAQA